LLGVNFADANLFSQITDFRFTIAGDDHDVLELMLRSEVLNKETSFGSRRIAQSEGRGELAVDYYHAFQSTGKRRKLFGLGYVL
jgi:hypothetical protein